MEDYIRRQILISLCVYVSQIVGGISYGWSAPFNQKLQDPEETPLPEVLTEEQASWVGAFLFAGTSVGPLLTGILSNTIGRKSCMVIGGIVSLAAVIILAAAQNITMIYVGRVLVGFGTGMIYIINIVYLGEIASTNIRGILLTGTAVFTTLGTLVIFTISPFMSYVAASYVLVAISGVYLVGLFFVPESPIFYTMNGNDEKAVQILESLGRTDPDDINKVLSSKEEKTITFMSQWTELFYKKSNRRALFVVLILLILQQFSGANVVTLFATQIFHMAGSTVAPHIATIIVGVTRLTGACIAPITVERAGRKVLLLISTSLCCLSLAILGLYFYLDESGHNMEVVGWLPLLILIVFYLSFDTGFGIIPSALTGEMFSSTARSIGSGLTITALMLVGFALSTAFAYLIAAIGAGATFWLLASACAVAFLFTMFYVLETRGKTFAEIQQMLS